MKKDDLLELLLKSGSLAFGNFKTKSGRESPYFFNTGQLNSAWLLGKTSDFYADKINALFGQEVQNIFGPAYKGIPLCVMVAERLAQKISQDVTFTFDRKEAKDHGEKGGLVGYQYKGGENVVIVEDVLTAGTSLLHTGDVLRPYGVKIKAAVVGVDREERADEKSNLSARQFLEKKLGINIYSLFSLSEILEKLYNKKYLGKIWIDEPLMARIKEYRKCFGAG